MGYLLLALILVPLVINIVKYGFGRLVVEDYSKIHPEASIIHVSHKKEGTRRNRHIRTIVKFADGVEYHSYDCKSQPGIGYTRYIVDAEVVEKITQKAIIAHRKLALKHAGKARENAPIASGDVVLSENILNEFSEYPKDFLRVVCNWFIQWQKSHPLSKYSKYDYLKALESCGKGRCRENGLEICLNIYKEKMMFPDSSINHMMKQLDDVLVCSDEEKRVELEDKVLAGLQGLRISEMMRIGKIKLKF